MSSGAAPSERFEFEIGDQAVLRALDDVVCEALVERQIGGFLLLPARCAAKMLGDGGDVKLIDGDLLVTRLQPPILRNIFEHGGVGMICGHVDGRGVKQQSFG